MMTQQKVFPISTLTKFALFLLFIGLTVDAASQNREVQNSDTLFLLRGNVSCRRLTAGPLSDVAVFNISKDSGVMSDSLGNFSIKMASGDTIVFSTTQHRDYIFYLRENDKQEDLFIEIEMEPDVIWLETVTIMGNQSLEEFKREIMLLETSTDDRVDVVLPVVSKYAKQLSSGDGAFVLTGPLTYLGNKFRMYYKTRKKIEDKMTAKK